MHIFYPKWHSPFCGTYANFADPYQTPQKGASDQDRHCLLAECSIKTVRNWAKFLFHRNQPDKDVYRYMLVGRRYI